MILRDYQERAIASARAAIAGGARSVLLVSPTGSGKTTIGASIAARAVEAGGRVLWLAHRTELVGQAADRLESAGLRVGVIAAGTARAQPYAPVQVASVQTLRARGELPPASLVIYDEARHYVADDWGALATAYSESHRIGLDATPERADGRGLGALFDSLVMVASVRELIDAGHLVPCEVISPDKALASGEIAQHPVDAYMEHARDRKTILFAPHLKAAREYLDAFHERGIPVGLVHGELAAVQRSQVIRRYRDGHVRVLVNVYVLTEGFDDPPTSCAILARGCGTAGTYLQMVGRILRPAPGKADALLIDLRGVVHVHGKPDEDRTYSLDGKAIRRKDEIDTPPICLVCGAVKDPSGVCPDCGRAPSELASPTVVGVALGRFAAKRMEDEATRTATLRRWLEEGQRRGFRPGWACFRYQGTYGMWPPRSVLQAATIAAASAEVAP